jgi:hypothetical protein
MHEIMTTEGMVAYMQVHTGTGGLRKAAIRCCFLLFSVVFSVWKVVMFQLLLLLFCYFCFVYCSLFYNQPTHTHSHTQHAVGDPLGLPVIPDNCTFRPLDFHCRCDVSNYVRQIALLPQVDRDSIFIAETQQQDQDQKQQQQQHAKEQGIDKGKGKDKGGSIDCLCQFCNKTHTVKQTAVDKLLAHQAI